MATRIRKSAVERKAEIVETAIRLAADCGPDRLTTERLAEEIGISQPAIFRHFPKKTDIWEAVGKRICDLMGASGEKDNNPSPRGRLKNNVTNHFAFVCKTPAVPAILFSQELHSQNEPLRNFFSGLMKQRHENMTNLIQAGIDAGEFKSEIIAADAAYLILALIQGLAMRWSLNNRSFDLTEEGERLLDLQLFGFDA